MIDTSEDRQVAGSSDRRSGPLILAALSFQSALPLNVRVEEGDLGKSMRYFPLIGLLFGAVLTAAAWTLNNFGLTEIAGISLTFMSVLMSRAMHLDGVADSADGLLGGGDRESRLRIMSDSSIGAFGAAAIGLVLLAKYSFFGLIAALPPLWPLLILAPAWGRLSSVYAAYAYPSAKREGMARTFKIGCGGREFAIASATAIASTLALLPFGQAITMILWSTLITFLSSRALTRNIGGISGDLMGTLIETTEIFFLVGGIIFIR